MNTNEARTKEWVRHLDRDGSHAQSMVKFRLVIHGVSEEHLGSKPYQSIRVPSDPS
jgi:hypothetical protein